MLAEENFENKINLFGKGEVGDWINYLSPRQVEQLTKVMDRREVRYVASSGLSFKVFS